VALTALRVVVIVGIGRQPIRQRSPGISIPGLLGFSFHLRFSNDHPLITSIIACVLNHHLVFVEQVEALDEQLMRAALDVEHAEGPRPMSSLAGVSAVISSRLAA